MPQGLLLQLPSSRLPRRAKHRWWVAQPTLVRPRPSHRSPPLPTPQPGPVPASRLPARVPPPSPEQLAAGPVAVEPVVAYALAQNPAIQAARFNALAMLAEVPQVTTLPDPTLLTTIFLEPIQTAAGPQQVAMSLAQMFPWFGELELRGSVACHDARVALARVVVEQLRVMEEAKQGYYMVYYYDRATATTKKLERPLQDIIEIARTRYETGLGGVGLESVLQAQVELSNLQARLIELRQEKQEAQARLAGLLHLPPHIRIEPVEQLKLTPVAGAEELVALVQRCQPELAARREAVQRDQASIELARKQYWPDVTTSFTWYEFGDRGLSPVATGEDAFSLGVGVNLPIYRKRLDAAVREAQHRTAQSNRLFAAGVDQYTSRAMALYQQLEQHDEVLQILGTDILPRARQTLELAIEAYRVGNVSFQQLIANYQVLLNFEVQYYQRQMLREQAVASLERAVGCVVTGPAGAAASEEPEQPELVPAPSPQ